MSAVGPRSSYLFLHAYCAMYSCVCARARAAVAKTSALVCPSWPRSTSGRIWVQRPPTLFAHHTALQCPMWPTQCHCTPTPCCALPRRGRPAAAGGLLTRDAETPQASFYFFFFFLCSLFISPWHNSQWALSPKHGNNCQIGRKKYKKRGKKVSKQQTKKANAISSLHEEEGGTYSSLVRRGKFVLFLFSLFQFYHVVWGLFGRGRGGWVKEKLLHTAMGFTLESRLWNQVLRRVLFVSVRIASQQSARPHHSARFLSAGSARPLSPRSWGPTRLPILHQHRHKLLTI